MEGGNVKLIVESDSDPKTKAEINNDKTNIRFTIITLYDIT